MLCPILAMISTSPQVCHWAFYICPLKSNFHSPCPMGTFSNGPLIIPHPLMSPVPGVRPRARGRDTRTKKTWPTFRSLCFLERQPAGAQQRLPRDAEDSRGSTLNMGSFHRGNSMYTESAASQDSTGKNPWHEGQHVLPATKRSLFKRFVSTSRPTHILGTSPPSKSSLFFFPTLLF